MPTLFHRDKEELKLFSSFSSKPTYAHRTYGRKAFYFTKLIGGLPTPRPPQVIVQSIMLLSLFTPVLGYNRHNLTLIFAIQDAAKMTNIANVLGTLDIRIAILINTNIYLL
jgi:hypothetical protein